MEGVRLHIDVVVGLTNPHRGTVSHLVDIRSELLSRSDLKRGAHIGRLVRRYPATMA